MKISAESGLVAVKYTPGPPVCAVCVCHVCCVGMSVSRCTALVKIKNDSQCLTFHNFCIAPKIFCQSFMPISEIRRRPSGAKNQSPYISIYSQYSL